MSTILQKLSLFLRHIWLLFPAVLFTLITGVLFSTLSQGKDVLLLAAENPTSSTLLIVGVSFLAFICWYTSNLILYINNEVNNQYNKTYADIIPAVLGYAIFFGIEAAIISNNYFDSTHDALWIWLLLAAQAIIFAVIYFVFEKKNPNPNFSYWVLGIVLVVVLLSTMFVSRQGAVQFNFTLQLINLWVVQTAFLIWVFIRIKSTGRNFMFVNWETVTIFGRKIVRLPSSEVSFFWQFNIAVILPVALYLISIFNTEAARAIGPINVVLLSFSILTGFLHLVTMVSVRSKINLHFLLFIVAIIMGLFTSPYQLRKETAQQKAYSNRPDLKTFAYNWITARKTEIENTDTFKVYFVLADGGASRSGYWVAGALGRLETDTKHEFSKHLFCLSGASGGSVGNAVYYALLDEGMKDKTIHNGDYSLMARNYLKSDFLSYTLSHMLGPDFFRHILPLHLTVDRSAALEKSMENPNFNDTVGKLFAKPYSQYVSSLSDKQPIFYINTTRVNDGNPGVVSNIALNRSFTSRIDVLAMMDTIGDNKGPFGDIHLSTAAVLSARFPYISPAADISHNYFVDGGYFDNSGAGIVMETIAGLKEIFNSPEFDSLPTQKLQFNIIHLSNSERTPYKANRIHPMLNDIATPLLTLANSYGSQTNVNNDRLRAFIRAYANNNCTTCWTTVNLYDRNPAVDKDTNTFSMNWVISATTLHRMDYRLLKNENLNMLIGQINQAAQKPKQPAIEAQ